MVHLFLSILDMSITGSFIIILIMLLRLLLKMAPKFISYLLWGIVAVRLVIPISISSIFSFMPRDTNVSIIPKEIIYQRTPQINSGIETIDSFVSQLLPKPVVGESMNPLQLYAEIGASIWVLGILAFLIYSTISILHLKKIIKSNLKNVEGVGKFEGLEANIFEVENLKTPFVFGVIKPKIYIPCCINEDERNYILLHEQNHIKRNDHIVKIIAFFILAIHWFNPLVWISFILMSLDMELSCDERVLKEMKKDIKKSYANTLLSLAVGKQMLKGSPLAFSEGNVTSRIKNILNYKKPKLWMIIVSIIFLLVVGIGFMTNPISKEKQPSSREISEISKKWAEAFKHRDGEARYELMEPQERTNYYLSLVSENGEEFPWIIGDSSPYVVSYDIEISGASAVITYITKTSVPEVYIYQEELSFITRKEKTFVEKYQVIVSYMRNDLYEQAIEIQKQVDEGKQAWRLDPESVVMEFVHRDFVEEGSKIVSQTQYDFVIENEDGHEVKIKLYRPINIVDGFLAVYEYENGEGIHILANNYIAPVNMKNQNKNLFTEKDS